MDERLKEFLEKLDSLQEEYGFTISVSNTGDVEVLEGEPEEGAGFGITFPCALDTPFCARFLFPGLA